MHERRNAGRLLLYFRGPAFLHTGLQNDGLSALVSGTAHRALGTSSRGPALCLSVALFASDNRKFLHGRMEGAITHNEGPVRLVVWELLLSHANCPAPWPTSAPFYTQKQQCKKLSF